MLIRLALAQMNPTVGELSGNARRIAETALAASRAGADIVLFPELALTGYPPEDLLLKRGFLRQAGEVMATELAPSLAGLPLLSVIGTITGDTAGLRNSAVVLSGSGQVAVYHKILLPNYGVFDERRYFVPGDSALVMDAGGLRIGVSICEDIWYDRGPTGSQAAVGARLILNCNASPYHREKWRERQSMLADRAAANGVFIAYANMVGGQDELVFDGHSMLFAPDGKILAEASQFEEDLLIVDIDVAAGGGSDMAESPVSAAPDRHELLAAPVELVALKHSLASKAGVPLSRAPSTPSTPSTPSAPFGPEEEVYRALVLGVRDYVRKNGFGHAVLGLSGGIDSAVVAAIAVDALGAERVTGVNMPSRYSSAQGIADAEESARLLGIKLESIPIERTFVSLMSALEPVFTGTEAGVAEENLQARIRGSLIMALSNKFGWLVLTTGNKSEMACGYATLYGDMAGGFAAIKDVPKTLVYRLAEWRNQWSPAEGGRDGAGERLLMGPAARIVVPRSVIEKPPSAELRPDQKDSDSLPPYDILDPIIEEYVGHDRSISDIAAMGFERGVVELVAGLIDRSEYKRRQAPPGVKITPKAFGRDRRMPITNGYRSH